MSEADPVARLFELLWVTVPLFIGRTWLVCVVLVIVLFLLINVHSWIKGSRHGWESE